MKKSFITNPVLVLLVGTVLFSCGDDKGDDALNNDFTLSASELNMVVGVMDTVYIDGDGVFTALSENSGVANAFIENEKTYIIYPSTVGTTVITFTDGSANSSPKQLKVSVTERSERYLFGDQYLIIQLADDTYREEIREDCIKSSILSLGNWMELTFLSHKSGNIYVYKEGEEPFEFEGSFSLASPVQSDIQLPLPVETLFVKSGDSEYIFTIGGEFVICFNGNVTTKASIMDSGFSLEEDFTEKYRQQYPQAGIVEVNYCRSFHRQAYYN